jgi:hypothetical protein
MRDPPRIGFRVVFPTGYNPVLMFIKKPAADFSPCGKARSIVLARQNSMPRNGEGKISSSEKRFCPHHPYILIEVFSENSNVHGGSFDFKEF